MGSWLTCLVISYCFLTLYRNEGNFVQGEDLAIKNASENNYKYAEPTVMIAILVRNKAHILPWFFGHLEKLNYPKNRISFWWVLLIFFFFFSKKCFYAFFCLFTNDMNSYLQMIWTALETCVGDISYLYLALLLRIRSDHNEDDSARMLREWVDANKNVYHNIDLVIEDNKDSKWCCFHFILYSNRCIMQQFEVCQNEFLFCPIDYRSDIE